MLSSSRLKIIAACALMFLAGAVVTHAWLTSRPAEVRLLQPGESDLIAINGCVVTAFDYMAAVEARHRLEPNFWARVMLVRYSNYSGGHAYCVWEADGRVYGYDRSSGSFPIPTNVHDPKGIAQSLSTGISEVVKKNLIVQSAEFIEPAQAKIRAF